MDLAAGAVVEIDGLRASGEADGQAGGGGCVHDEAGRGAVLEGVGDGAALVHRRDRLLRARGGDHICVVSDYNAAVKFIAVIFICC